MIVKNRTGMKSRYWFISTFLLLLICAYLFFYFYEAERTREIQEIIGHQKIHAKQAARNFSELFEKWNSVLYYLSTDRNVIAVDNNGKYKIESLQKILKDEINGITRVNKSGIIVYSTPFYPNTVGRDISSQKHMLQILNDHQPVVSDVFTAVQGYQAIVIHYPVFKNNKFDGTIAFLLNFRQISKKILDVTRMGNSATLMLSSDGIELYSSTPERLGKPVRARPEITPGFSKLVDNMLLGGEGSYNFKDAFGNRNGSARKIAYYVPVKIDHGFWSIALIYSEDEITASLYGFRNKLIFIFGMIFLGGILISYFGIKAWIIVKEADIKRIAEKELKESEERYRLIFSIASDYMFSTRVDEKGNLHLEWVSGAFEMITGYTFDEYVKAGGWHASLYPDDLAQDEKDMAMLQNRQHVISEIRTITKTEKIVWVRVYAFPIWDEKENKLTGIYGAVQNITEKKNAEEALRRSEARYRYLFEHNPAPMFIYEKRTLQILAINGAFQLHYGYSYADAVKMRLQDFYIEEEKESIIALTFQLHGYRDVGEWHHVKQDGTVITIIGRSHDIFFENRSARVVVIMDISELKKAEQVLVEAKENAEKSERLKSHFLAQMSHEIRSPINNMLNYAELIKVTLKPELLEEQKESINAIEQAGGRIVRTIDLILNMSELQTGNYHCRVVKVNVAEMLNTIFSEYKFKAEKKNIKLLLNMVDKELNIQGDEYSVYQIFVNLVDNAIKYTDMGFVEIKSFCSDAGKVTLQVKDTGIGISEEYLGNIFTPFSQEEQGYTRRFEGNGLGLALVKKYCEINNAEIEVESKKGEGSTFKVIFNC